MEKIPQCRFCGEPVYEGNKFKTQSGKVLYLCIDCWQLLSAVIEEAIPEKLRQFMDAAETAILKEDRLKTFCVKEKEA